MILDQLALSTNISAVKKSNLSPYKHGAASKAYGSSTKAASKLGKDSVENSLEARALAQESSSTDKSI